jgi:nucleoside-diphosphate-sugar epimerase
MPALSPQNILITGATGFIGGCLARHLVAQGHQVRALVRREAPELAMCGVELVRADIGDANALPPVLRDMDAVFHLAAVRDVWGTPETVYRQINVDATRALLAAARVAGVPRFVYCSSVGVARYAGNLAADETLPFSPPTSQVLYHCTKARAEQIARDAQAVVVRPVITYGPGDENGFLTRLIALLAQGRFLGIGNGRNHVDLVYVDDLVAGMVAALEKGAPGRVYILSGTAPIEVRVLVDEICTLLGRKPPRISIPTPIALLAGWGMELVWKRVLTPLGWSAQAPFITRDKVATLTVDRGFSHARAALELGYRPQVDYNEGLKRTLDWMRAQAAE